MKALKITVLSLLITFLTSVVLVQAAIEKHYTATNVQELHKELVRQLMKEATPMSTPNIYAEYQVYSSADGNNFLVVYDVNYQGKDYTIYGQNIGTGQFVGTAVITEDQYNLKYNSDPGDDNEFSDSEEEAQFLNPTLDPEAEITGVDRGEEAVEDNGNYGDIGGDPDDSETPKDEIASPFPTPDATTKEAE